MIIKVNVETYIRECKYYQKTVDLLFKRLPFTRLVKDITTDMSSTGGIKWRSSALVALQYMSESMLTMHFQML